MQHVTDMKPHDRDAYVTAKEMLANLRIPLVAAVEDYVRSRKIAGTESLASMATDYSQHFGKIARRATVPEVVAHLMESKKQDGASGRQLPAHGQARTPPSETGRRRSLCLGGAGASARRPDCREWGSGGVRRFSPNRPGPQCGGGPNQSHSSRGGPIPPSECR